jgi:hypothetical protein
MNTQIEETLDSLLRAMTIPQNGWQIWMSLGTALVFAGILWGTYRLANQEETYQSKFAATLVTLSLISTILMDLIQTNLALSLGMIGSLSIVRFRTNIKDPRDIGFIFWAMAIGIAASTQSYLIGIIGSILLAGIMIFTKKNEEENRQLLLVIRGSNTDLDRIQEVVGNGTNHSLVKAKNILADSFEIVYEIQIPEKNGNRVIEHIFELGGIDSVNLLSQNG